MVVWVAENAVERVEHAEEAGEAIEKWVNIIVDDQVVTEEVVEAGAQEDEEEDQLPRIVEYSAVRDSVQTLITF